MMSHCSTIVQTLARCILQEAISEASFVTFERNGFVKKRKHYKK